MPPLFHHQQSKPSRGAAPGSYPVPDVPTSAKGATMAPPAESSRKSQQGGVSGDWDAPSAQPAHSHRRHLRQHMGGQGSSRDGHEAHDRDVEASSSRRAPAGPSRRSREKSKEHDLEDQRPLVGKDGGLRVLHRPPASNSTQRLFDPDSDQIPTAGNTSERGPQRGQAMLPPSSFARSEYTDEGGASGTGGRSSETTTRRIENLRKRAENERQRAENERNRDHQRSERDRHHGGDSEKRRGAASHGSRSEGHDRHDRRPRSLARSGGDHESVGSNSRTADSRQLFDPRKDDPVKFGATQKRSLLSTGLSALSHVGSGSVSASVTANSLTSASVDSRSMASTAPSGSACSSEVSRDRRRRRGSGKARSEPTDDEKADVGNRPRSEPSVSGKGGEQRTTEVNAYVRELQRVYKEIVELEERLKEEHRTAQEGGNTRGISLKGKASEDGVDHAYWLRIEGEHKRLAETHAQFMEMAFRPGVPASLHSYPTKYNVPARLWHSAFHIMLERLRHSLPPATAGGQTQATRAALLDHLTEFIYFAYAYYSNLLESETFRSFRTVWMENLGDLARYRMAVTSLFLMGQTTPADRAQSPASPSQASSQLDHRPKGKQPMLRTGQPAAPSTSRAKMSFPRIDDEDDSADEGEDRDRDSEASGHTQHEAAMASHAKRETDKAAQAPPADKASIGQAAIGTWELEERETWKVTARDWYAKGLADMPGTGRLHHHLGLLSRGDDLRTLHHFCKSMTSSHPYAGARESLLPLFERELQTARARPDAPSVEIFVHLHGMLFTKIQLDDFDHIFARFRDRLQQDSAKLGQDEWIMMASISVAALLQYGAEDAVLYSTDMMGASVVRTKVEPSNAPTDHDDGGAQEASEASRAPDAPAPAKAFDDLPIALQHSIRLSFAIMDVALKEPSLGHDASQPSSAGPNAFVATLLTFVSTMLKQPTLLPVIERFVPWASVVRLSTKAPVPIDPRLDQPSKIGAEVPLPEDWCLRGMAWVGRRVYERGFWKPASASSASSSTPPSLVFESEIDVLLRSEREHEDVDVDEQAMSDSQGHGGAEPRKACVTLASLRWQRFAYALTALAKVVPGLDFDEQSEQLIIVAPLSSKLLRWAAEEQEEQLQRLMSASNISKGNANANSTRTRVASDAEGEGGEDDEDDDDDEDEEGDSEQIRELKARRRELRAILRAAKAKTPGGRGGAAGSTSTKSKKPIGGTKGKADKAGAKAGRTSPEVVPGYTILVLDTNILVTPGGIFERLVDSRQWTVVVPLSVITELDGLKRNKNALGDEARRAVTFLEKAVKSHSQCLRVQTSRGNYLADLTFRTEEIDFGGAPAGPAPTMGAAQGETGLAVEGEVTTAAQFSTTPTVAAGVPSEAATGGAARYARTLDEVILRCVEWQSKHFVERPLKLLAGPATPMPPHASSNVGGTANVNANLSAIWSSPATSATPSIAQGSGHAILSTTTSSSRPVPGLRTAKVALVTMDRALRIKARAMGLETLGSASEIGRLLSPAG